MKTIGLLGGMSWESTVRYYQIINQVIKTKLGGLHSAKIILYSVDFAEIEACQVAGDWGKSAEILAAAAHTVERAGADFLVICTNTMHKVIPHMQAHITIPIVHIADATACTLQACKIKTVGLLGTKYTMTQDFYTKKLVQAGIHVLVPTNDDIEIVNRVIYDELCCGIIRQESKKQYLAIIEKLRVQGSEGVILGCTEIGLLIQQEDTTLPVFDTTYIHALRAALQSIE